MTELLQTIVLFHYVTYIMETIHRDHCPILSHDLHLSRSWWSCLIDQLSYFYNMNYIWAEHDDWVLMETMFYHMIYNWGEHNDRVIRDHCSILLCYLYRGDQSRRPLSHFITWLTSEPNTMMEQSWRLLFYFHRMTYIYIYIYIYIHIWREHDDGVVIEIIVLTLQYDLHLRWTRWLSCHRVPCPWRPAPAYRCYYPWPSPSLQEKNNMDK